MAQINSYFKSAIKNKASDIHLVAGEKPMIRIEGELKDLADSNLPEKELETAIFGILSAEQKVKFEEELELDMAYEVDGVRFRVNVHKQEGKIGLAARLIPKEIPTPDDLLFEALLFEFPSLMEGLVLVVGPTTNTKPPIRLGNSTNGASKRRSSGVGISFGIKRAAKPIFPSCLCTFTLKRTPSTS